MLKTEVARIVMLKLWERETDGESFSGLAWEGQMGDF